MRRKHRWCRNKTVLAGKAMGLSVLLLAQTLQIVCVQSAFGQDALSNNAVMLPPPPMLRDGDGKSASSGKTAFEFQATESSISAHKAEALPITPGQPILADRLQQLLKRLPAFTAAPESNKPSFSEQNVVKPDRQIAVMQQTFPPPPGAAGQKPSTAPVGALEIQRVSASGQCQSVADLAIQFSQPMVAIADVDTVNDPAKLPVKLSPQPAGNWRWMGAQTLVFQPTGRRFPQATTYNVEIPAGVHSQLGGVLAKSKSWSFVTAPPKVVDFMPQQEEKQGSKPVMILVFDQRIDPQTVLKSVHLSSGSRQYQLHLLPRSAVPENTVPYLGDKPTPLAHWFAFSSNEDLPLDSSFEVTVNAGCPSLEGPNTSTEDESYTVETYGKLKIDPSFFKNKFVELASQSGGSQLSLPFTNELEAKSFKASMLHVSPAVAGLQVYPSDTQLYITGRILGHTKYTVTIDGALADTRGQHLGKPVTATFVTGTVLPAVDNPPDFVTIPSGHRPVVPFTISGVPRLTVTVSRVQPGDWVSWYRQRKPIGTIVKTQTIISPNKYTSLNLDLTPYLTNGSGQFVVHTQAPGVKEFEPFNGWVQVTDIGLDAYRSTDLLVAASELGTGKPMAQVSTSLLPSAAMAMTDGNGTARLTLPAGDDDRRVLVARKGSDVAILPSSGDTFGGSGWTAVSSLPVLQWYSALDTDLYRPGDELQFKGWLREQHFSKRFETEILRANANQISYKATIGDATLAQGKVNCDSYGGFSGHFKIPAHTQLGEGSLLFSPLSSDPVLTKQYKTRQEETAVGFQIQEFRKPEFEMTVATLPGECVFPATPVKMTATASYYAGGPLPDAPVSWSFNVRQTQFSPPGWEQYSFGRSTPWFFGDSGINQQLASAEVAGTTDPSGRHSVDLKFGKSQYPVSCDAECTITDPNHQTFSQSTSVLLHPSDIYVGVELARFVYDKDQPIGFKFVTVNSDGKAQSGKTVHLSLCHTNEEKTLQTLDVVSSAGDSNAEFKSMPAGDYQITAETIDEQGNKNKTQVSAWVERVSLAPSDTNDQQKALVVPDKETYNPGETAQLFITSPFSPAHGIVTVRRHGIPATYPVSLTGPSTKIQIPISADYYPNAQVQVDLQGQESAYASGNVNLMVKDESHRLNLSVEPPEESLSPASDSVLNVVLKDSQGHPVKQGQVAVTVVDEAVLALNKYAWPNPIEDVFYQQVDDQIDDLHLRQTVINEAREKPTSMIFRGRPQFAALPIPMPQAAPADKAAPMEWNSKKADMLRIPVSKEFGMSEPPQFNVRKAFNACALFAPSVITDDNGKAQVKLHLPGNLTKYRIMAAAVAQQNLFGNSQSSLTARLPLMVRPSPPRFLNIGDKCNLPVTVQNQTTNDMNVAVVARADNAVIGNDKGAAGCGQSISVPANSTRTVDFPLQARAIGTVQLQFAATSGDFSDAAEQSIPVQKPATFEAFAAYGEIDDGSITQKVEPPKNAIDGVGGLTVTTSSTAMEQLSDAYIYLRDYQFECSEQISARVLATLALRDVLSQFGKLNEQERFLINDRMKKDIQILTSRHRNRGGYGLWSAGETEDYPYVSLQVIRALYLANDKDFKINNEELARCSSYLSTIDAHISHDYLDSERLAIRAYTAFLMHSRGGVHNNESLGLAKNALASFLKADIGGKRRKNTINDVSLESAAWLLPVLAQEKGNSQYQQLLQLINNNIRETASTASVDSNDIYGASSYLLFYSPVRCEAVVLEALELAEPTSTIIPKLVKGLVSKRRNGAWQGTQENCMVLLALERYFATYEKAKPDFEARVWLGNNFAGSNKFIGRSTDRQEISVPMKQVEQLGPQDLLINKNGSGRLYYRVGLEYARENMNVSATDNGFSVERVYQSIDNPSDVHKDESGTWHFKTGADIKVKVTFSSSGSRHYVALVDPLAAGVEPLNPALAGTRVMFDKPDSRVKAPEGTDDSAAPVPPPAPPAPTPSPQSLPAPPMPPSMNMAQPVPAAEDNELVPTPWWTWPWFEHQNLRDNQAEAFATHLPAGTYTYSYIIRATTPGAYIVPPCKAEEMYSPETFGRTATEHVIIE